MAKVYKVAVVMGGPSAEREVSLKTGQAIVEALIKKGYEVVAIDLDPRRFVEQITASGANIVFNAVHGLYGEDGVLAGALDLLGLPYTGSGVLAGAVSMDKGVSKRLFWADKIPTPRAVLYDKATAREEMIAEITGEFGFPLVVKAVAQGSSLGVTVVNESRELPGAVEEAFNYCQQILVEQFIHGKEVTVGVYGNDSPVALPVIQIKPHSGRYDYHSKYTRGSTDYIVPAPLQPEITEKIQAAAIRAYRSLGCRGIARVDIMLDELDQPYVLEVNTVPGMTETSLVPKAAAALGISFADLCEKLLLMSVQ